MNLDETLRALLEKVQTISRSETVVGDARKIGDTTIVPISRVRIGFAVGTHDRGEKSPRGKAEGGVTGGGILVDPVAILYIDGDGKAQMFLLGRESSPVLAKIIELVPEAIQKLIGKREQQNSAD